MVSSLIVSILLSIFLTNCNAEVTSGSIYALSFPSLCGSTSLSQFSPYLTVTNLASQSVTVDISCTAANFKKSAKIDVNKEATFELIFERTSVFLPCSNAISNKTVLVCASGSVSLYGFIAEGKNDVDSSVMVTNPWDETIQGAFLALPANALGKEYLIPAYPTQEDFTTVFTVSALEDNTAVTISFEADTTPPGTRRFELQIGESYQVVVPSIVTLSNIKSNASISVIAASKSETNEVFLLKQVSPNESFGTGFIVTPFEGGSYDYCIVATEATTVSKCMADESSSVCQQGQDETINGLKCVQDIDVSVYLKITTDKPVAIYQYIKDYSSSSDGLVCLAMNIVPPIENYLSDVKYTVIGDGNIKEIKTYIISNSDMAFEVDGEELDMDIFLKAQVEDMYVYRRPVSRAGRHTISSKTTDKFMVIVYGGKHADGVVTTTPDVEGSGGEPDVVPGRYESYFAYRADFKSNFIATVEVFQCIVESAPTAAPLKGLTTQATTTNAPKIEDSFVRIIADIISNGNNSDAPNVNVIVAEVVVIGENTITLEETLVVVNTGSDEVEVIVIQFEASAIEGFTNNIQYKNTHVSQTTIASKITSIDMFTVGRLEEIKTLSEGITIVSNITKPGKISEETQTISTSNVQPICSYYDEEKKFWDNKGCITIINGNNVECKCNHLTMFAVLMQITEYPLTSVDAKVLDILTKLGLSLSIISLVITLVIYIYCKLYTSHRILIHGNLALALLISHLIFVSGIEVNEHKEKSCTAITFFMHFFFMATFFWMLVEGLYLVAKTRHELHRRNIPFAIWAVIGWVPALLIVIISAASRIDGYGYPIYEFVGDILTKRYRCWLDHSTGLVWAFVGPACVILAVNLCILILVLRFLCTAKVNEDENLSEHIKSGIRVVFILGVILGLPWILGLLNLNQYTVAVSYLFVLGNAFQGVYILLSLCIFDKEVQHVLQAKDPIRKCFGHVNRNQGSRNRITPDTSSATEEEAPIISRATVRSREAWVKDDPNPQQDNRPKAAEDIPTTSGTSNRQVKPNDRKLRKESNLKTQDEVEKQQQEPTIRNRQKQQKTHKSSKESVQKASVESENQQQDDEGSNEASRDLNINPPWVGNF
ncbi:uncharacterized protein [Amphiura filiformis]|uniref:uncharacterized protein isoform X2 n=1 Tax=Amphiura filiformis TaxID=82378 RepID=UPI003B212F04